MIFSSAAWDFAWGAVRLVVYLLCAVFVVVRSTAMKSGATCPTVATAMVETFASGLPGGNSPFLAASTRRLTNRIASRYGVAASYELRHEATQPVARPVLQLEGLRAQAGS